MANYALYQESAKGKAIIEELQSKGINIVVESNGGTSSTIKIDGVVVAKGVIPYIKGYIEGLHRAIQ